MIASSIAAGVVFGLALASLDVWVNPEGGHMGRSERWPQGKVLSEIVEPWVLRRLGVAQTAVASKER